MGSSFVRRPFLHFQVGLHASSGPRLHSLRWDSGTSCLNYGCRYIREPALTPRQEHSDSISYNLEFSLFPGSWFSFRFHAQTTLTD